MASLRCYLCSRSQPSNDIPQDFKAVLRDFIRVFNKFQPYRFNIVNVTDFPLCRSCWIYFMRIHKLNEQLSAKREACGAKSELLSFKIRQAQKLLQNSNNHQTSCEDFHVQDFAKGKYNEGNEMTADSTSSDSSTTYVNPTEELESLGESDCKSKEVEKNDQLVTRYEDKWLPNNLTLPKTPSAIKRLSEVDFIYMDKYPFQGTQAGFKCGLCSAICKFYNRSRIWDNIISHLRTRHMGNPRIRTRISCKNSNRRVRANNQFIEIAPNRFQYGKYTVEKIDGKYRCGECGVLKPARPGCETANIMKHIANSHANPSVCEDCGKVYYNRADLNQHKISKHGYSKGKFPCSECGKVFASRLRASAHRLEVHRKRERVACESCGKNFRHKAALENHVAILHKNDGPLPNENIDESYSGTSQENQDGDSAVCGSSSVSVSASLADQEPAAQESGGKTDSESQAIATHQPTSFENKWLPKNLTLPKSSPVVKRLSEVDFIYMDKYPFQGTPTCFKCGLCSAISAFYEDLPIWSNMIAHIKTWHKGNHKVRAGKVFHKLMKVAPNRFQYGKYIVEQIEGSYRCGECGEIKAIRSGGSKAAGILEHINSKHENPRTHVCEYCGRVFKNLQGLRNHKLAEHEIPTDQFPCSDCDKTFVSRAKALTHHKIVHQGIYKGKKFICEICGKGCSQKLALENHVAFVHNGKKVECKDCDKTFASYAALTTHRNSHTGKKYTCDICGMEFTQHYSVSRHKKTAHGQ